MPVPFPALTPPHHFPSKTFNRGYKAFNWVSIATPTEPIVHATILWCERDCLLLLDHLLNGWTEHHLILNWLVGIWHGELCVHTASSVYN